MTTRSRSRASAATTAAATTATASLPGAARATTAGPVAAPAAAGSEPPSISLRVPVDEIAKYAGLTALVTAVLGVGGVVSSAAYLSAWGVPAPVIRLDPVSAALRSETVLYQLALLGAVIAGLTTLRRRLRRRPAVTRVALAAAGLAVVALTAMLVGGRAYGPALSLVGGVLLFVAHQRRWLHGRGLAALFAAIGLLAAFETGVDSGVLARDDPEWQTPAAITTRVPAAGLPGGAEEGGGWRYEGLYLVFRDGEAVYVSRAGLGARVWIVPTGNLMSLELGAR